MGPIWTRPYHARPNSNPDGNAILHAWNPYSVRCQNQKVALDRCGSVVLQLLHERIGFMLWRWQGPDVKIRSHQPLHVFQLIVEHYQSQKANKYIYKGTRWREKCLQAKFLQVKNKSSISLTLFLIASQEQARTKLVAGHTQSWSKGIFLGLYLHHFHQKLQANIEAC